MKLKWLSLFRLIGIESAEWKNEQVQFLDDEVEGEQKNEEKPAEKRRRRTTVENVNEKVNSLFSLIQVDFLCVSKLKSNSDSVRR